MRILLFVMNAAGVLLSFILLPDLIISYLRNIVSFFFQLILCFYRF